MSATEVAATSSGSAMPSTLVIPSGSYMPAAPHDFSQPGLYQIWMQTTSDPVGIQWTYYRMRITDPYSLATACAWSNIFGWADWWPYQPGLAPDSALTGKLTGGAVNTAPGHEPASRGFIVARALNWR